jgi:hypothetical protein
MSTDRGSCIAVAISHAITRTIAHDMRCVVNAFHVRADHVVSSFLVSTHDRLHSVWHFVAALSLSL